MRRQLPEECRTHAAAACFGEHAGRKRTLAGEVGAGGDSRAHDSTVDLGEEVERLGRHPSAQLLDLRCTLVREHRDPYLPPGLQVGIGSGGADDDHPRRQTDTCFRLSLVNGSRFQPAQRSLSVIPASRAIRSSSAGVTARNGTDRRSQRPSTSVK